MDINKVIISGRATKDPVIAVTSTDSRTTKTARWNMATKRFFKRSEEESDAHFLKFVAYNKVAELVEKYVHKGTKFTTVGYIDTYSYVKEGIRIPVVEFVAKEIYLTDAKPDEGAEVDEDGFMPCSPELEAEMDELFK